MAAAEEELRRKKRRTSTEEEKKRMAANEEEVQTKNGGTATGEEKKRMATTEEEEEEEEVQRTKIRDLAAVDISDPSTSSEQQKRKLTVDKVGREGKRMKKEEKEKSQVAPKTYRWISGEVKLEEVEAKASCQNAASFEIKEEKVSEKEPNESYKVVMKIIHEGLKYIKRDPRTSSHVISAIKVLEDEANAKRGTKTELEGKAIGDQIKLEKNEQQEEYFENF